MTREQAVARADRLNAEGDGRLWTAHRVGDEWRVVGMTVGGLRSTAPTGAHTEAKPKPPAPDDPRPALWRNISPYGAG